MSTDLRPALIGSALVHAGLVLAGLWSWMERPPPPPKPASVPVMLVSAPPGVAPAPEPSEPLSAPEPPSLAPAPPEPVPPEPSPPVPTPPAPSPPAPSPRPAPPLARSAQTAPAKPTPVPPKAAAPTPKPPLARPAPPRPAPTKPPPPATPSLDLGALKSRLARNSARSAPAASSPGTSAADLNTAKAQLVARLVKLWQTNCEAEGGDRINASVQFRLTQSGQLAGLPEVVGGLAGEPLVRTAQERAVRAVLRGAPYEELPPELLGQSITVRFDAQTFCANR